jgi:putative membrane protein
MSSATVDQMEKRLNRFAWILSVLVFLLVIMMRRYQIETSYDFSWLPPVYSLLNTFSFLILMAGLYFIRVKKNKKAHRSLMITAMMLSTLFLLLYVVYHFTTGETTFCRDGSIRYLYFFLLITHIVLAAVILPFILFTFIRAFTGQFNRHKKMARWVFPLWAYVTISGPVCYLLLQPCYG